MNRLHTFYLQKLRESGEFEEVLSRLQSGKDKVFIDRLSPSSFAFVAVGLSSTTHKDILLLTDKDRTAQNLQEDIRFFGHDNCYLYPAWDILPYEEEGPVLEISAQRLEALEQILTIGSPSRKKRFPLIVIVPIEALFHKTPSKDFFLDTLVTIKWGDTLDTQQLAQKLITGGYTRLPTIESHGEFSIRGGIIDILPPNFDNPVRIDLFGNDVESIRAFDLYTQRTLRDIPEMDLVTILPARERAILREAIDSNVSLASVLSYFPADILAVNHDYEKFLHVSGQFEELVVQQYNEVLTGHTEDKKILPPKEMYLTYKEIESELSRFQQLFHAPLPFEQQENSVSFNTFSFDNLEPSLESYLNLIAEKQKDGCVITIVCDNDGQVMRFDEILKEREISALRLYAGDTTTSASPSAEDFVDIILCVGTLQNGFSYPAIKMIFVTDREIFGRYKHRPMYRKIHKGKAIRSASEISRGDFVVHVDHGIGKFLGIRRQEIDRKLFDLLEILYQDDDKLLVPVDKIKNVQKYFAGDMTGGFEPELDKLGKKTWQNRKKKSQEKIEQMAQELLDLYARREVAGGFVFSPDTVWQSEFEASFLYDETPDQISSIEQTKRDMESSRPMDRLICGDVGFGKTEVAIRAAFKVVQEGKQVAVLVPTTILAQQHLNTFRERFADYPIRVEMLSRFKSPKQQSEIVQDILNGDVHVAIGTHRLLSKDVAFKNLGLVIIDEEQRFGVKQKEKLKAMRASVDVLTLTATPIPRTLYMALSGLRDMSLIATPPPNRYPIRTKTIHFDKEEIQAAIMRELNRGGQVFFVHNRVESIGIVAEKVKDIVPQARISIAHGQMPGRQLEKVMLDFIDGTIDVLVSTTIIENGLDIPNVNTMIVNRADAFGLAQLYQLRGRIGRDVKRAYAYLIVPYGRAITDAAVQRLAAIEEFTELGVGFNIAMRDLEIRGAGNILGREQHGCIMSIGFDLYCNLLEKTVAKLKDEALPQETSAEVKWNVDCYIPERYVPVESQRIHHYKTLSEATRIEQLNDLTDELRDRYGEIPPPVMNLINIARLKILAQQVDVTKVQSTKDGFVLTVGSPLFTISDRLKALDEEHNEIESVRADSSGAVHFTLQDSPDPAATLPRAVSILTTLAKKQEKTESFF